MMYEFILVIFLRQKQNLPWRIFDWERKINEIKKIKKNEKVYGNHLKRIFVKKKKYNTFVFFYLYISFV